MAANSARDWRKMFYVDHSPVSDFLNCALTLYEDFSFVQVKIAHKTVTLQKDDSSYTYQFEDLALLPHTCRSLKYHKTGHLHFNVQGKQHCSSEVENDDSLYREKVFSAQNKCVGKIQLFQNQWFCSVCQQRILKDSSYFSRVLPLPTENWSDFADMWFCHKHDDVDSNSAKCNVTQNGRLLPKQGDCFVSDTYVLVTDCHVNSNSVLIGRSGAITCRRCGCQIGILLENKNGVLNGAKVFKLYLYSLLIGNLDDCLFRQVKFSDRQRREKYFSMLLAEQSQIYTSFRFIVESPVYVEMNQQTSSKPSSYCLIWLMDTGASMYTSSPDEEEDVDCNNDPDRLCILVKKAVMKVLFKCQLSSAGTNRLPDIPTKSVISMWKKDNTVHSISLPHPVFLQLIDQLIYNSKSLPASQRLLNGFHVSYLGKTSSDFET